MKILVVVPAFYPAQDFGGPVPVIRGFARHLIERGHEVTVWTTNLASRNTKLGSKTEEREVDGMRTVYLNSVARYRWVGICPDVFRYLRRELVAYDVVHVYGYREFLPMAVALWAARSGKPYVLQGLGTVARRSRSLGKKLIYDTLFGAMILRKAAALIAKSQTDLQQYREAGVPEEKLVLIPNGIDLPDDAYGASVGEFRRAQGLDEESPLIVFLGRLHPIKGLDLLIKAFKHLDGRAQLAIVGPDEGYQRVLEQLIVREAPRGKIVFTGPLYGKEKWSAYLDADVYVLPSVFENFSYTTLEAISRGTPVVVTEGCGIAPWVKDRAGLVVPHDEEALASAMKRLLGDSGLREKLSEGGQRLLREEFSWGPLVGKLEALYKRVL